MELKDEILKWVSTLSSDETKFLVDSILIPVSTLLEFCDRERAYSNITVAINPLFTRPCDICPYQEVCYTITDLIKSIIEVTKKN